MCPAADGSVAHGTVWVDLYELGAHFVLSERFPFSDREQERLAQLADDPQRLKAHRARLKKPRKWRETPASAEAAHTHVKKGGLVGILPSSLSCVVLDVDGGGTDAALQVMQTLRMLLPVANMPSRRDDGRHLWFLLADAEETSNRTEHPAFAPLKVDVRGSNGFVWCWQGEAGAQQLLKGINGPIDVVERERWDALIDPPEPPPPRPDSHREVSAHRNGGQRRSVQVGSRTPWTVDAFRRAMPKPQKREGDKGGFRCPCPICGGTDRAWIRPGKNTAVIGGCNGNCSLPDIARAVGLLGGDEFSALDRSETPAERRERNAGYSKGVDPARLASLLIESPVLKAPDSRTVLDKFCQARGFDARRLGDSGWRGIHGECWGELDPILHDCGWVPYKNNRGQIRQGWPVLIDQGPAVMMPCHDSDGKPAGLRFRRIALPSWWKDKMDPPAKVVSMKSAPPLLYGAELLPMLTPGALVHVAEGENDAESLREHDVLAAVGIPGATIWRSSWTRAVVNAQPRHVVIWFDGDTAGQRNGIKLRNILCARGLVVRRATWPGMGGKDVNDLHWDGHLKSLIESSEA